MRRRVSLRAVTLLLLWLIVTIAVAADQPLLIMNLPGEGPLSATVKAAYTTLQPQYDIWWLKVHEPASRDRDPSAVVVGTTAPLLKEINRNLDEYVRKGGGLVFVANPASNQMEANNEFLRGFGVQMTHLLDKGQTLRLLPHSVTQDVGDLSAPGLRYSLLSDVVEPIVMQNGNPVAVAGMIGSGRLVVLSTPLLTVADESQAAGSPQAKLLAQAIMWAASQGTAAPGTGIGVGEASTGPPVAAGFAQKIVAEWPDFAPWQEIVKAAQSQLAALSMPLETLRYEKDKVSLVAPLQGRPALVVIGSHRDYEEAEAVALSEYVDSGGSLLVLGYGEQSTVKQIAALNKLLGEFGISYILGRPGGQGVLKRHPITEGLSQPGLLGPGGSVWAFADWPLVMLDDQAVASATEFRQGRIVVLDASMLLPPKAKQPATGEWSQSLLLRSARWLTGR